MAERIIDTATIKTEFMSALLSCCTFVLLPRTAAEATSFDFSRGGRIENASSRPLQLQAALRRMWSQNEGGQGMTSSASVAEAVTGLAGTFSGQLLQPGAVGYEEALR